MIDDEHDAKAEARRDRARLVGMTLEEFDAFEKKAAAWQPPAARARSFGPPTPATVQVAPARDPYDPANDTPTAGAERILPPGLRRGAHGAPRGVSYRAQVRRRYMHPRYLPASRWHSKNGSHPRDVVTWLTRGRLSKNVLERELVAALVRAGCHDGKRRRALYPVAALAYVLYYAAEKTHRRGYAAHVIGVPRGELSRRMGHFNAGLPVTEDTISHYLRELREIVGERGMLQWHQPKPSEAKRWDLPHSTHYLEDGRRLEQPVNVYWFVGEDWFAKNAGSSRWGADPFRGDPNAGYGQAKAFSESDCGSPSVGKESSALRAPPTENPAAARAASRPTVAPHRGQGGDHER